MFYVIMCGGSYTAFDTPRHFIEINGERIVDRTIRLLKENGCEHIFVSATDKRFDSCGVPRLEHQNFCIVNPQDGVTGYWLDAFYPHFKETDKVTFIFGDVYFTEDAIRQIVNCPYTDRNILYGTSDAKNDLPENWGEPFAYVVNDYGTFMRGVETVKRLHDMGICKRHPIVWELYRYLNGLDINVQSVLDTTYICIDDGTLDVDDWRSVEKIRRRFEHAPDDNSSCV